MRRAPHEAVDFFQNRIYNIFNIKGMEFPTTAETADDSYCSNGGGSSVLKEL
jgi:hypothetical protein